MIMQRATRPLILFLRWPTLRKAEISAYTKKDGTFVAAHTDSRPSAQPEAAPAVKLTPAERFELNMAKKSPADASAFRAARADGVAIPPAWTGVIYYGKEPADGKIAVGYDAVGRKQVVESQAYRDRQIALKHERIRANLAPIFPRAVAVLRQAARNGDEASQVLYLITQTGFRIGGRGDGRSRHAAYGASTLLGEHASVKGNTVTFDFPGKHGVTQQHQITDPVIAAMFRETPPGRRVFTVSDAKIRAAWKAVGGEKVHDIRSLLATQIAEREVAARVPPVPATARARMALKKEVATIVAKTLGNNPSESLKTYIDHTVFERVAA
jgi:DNA topoisomerase-1